MPAPSPASKPAIGVIGLGSMGFGIAASLLRAGFSVTGYDISRAQVEKLTAMGGAAGALPGRPESTDILIVVVVNAAQMRDVLFGPSGAAASLKPGGLIIACPTVSPQDAGTFEAELAQRGLLYLDAPISGGAQKAGDGALTVMASGTPLAFAAAEPVLEAIAEKVFRLGDAAGPGSAMKAVNQLLAGVHIAAAAEAVTFGLSQGIPPARTLEVISECAGTSWMFENRVPHIVEADYTPRSAVDIFIKDLGIVGAIAAQARFSAPLTAAALQQFVAAGGMGLGREDDAAVAKVYARNAGLKLPGED